MASFQRTDDILVFSQTCEEFMRHLCCVLGALKQAGLTANQKQSHLGCTSVQYLGFQHWGRQDMGRARQSRSAGCGGNPPLLPQTCKGWCCTKLYRVGQLLLLLCALQQPPSTTSSREGRWGKTPMPKWNSPGGLPRVKGHLVPVCALAAHRHRRAAVHPLYRRLHHVTQGWPGPDDSPRREAYFLPQLQIHTTRNMVCAIIEKETLAMRWAINELCYYLWGQTFTVIMDHTPLQWVF